MKHRQAIAYGLVKMVKAISPTNNNTNPDPFAERPFLVFWELTRACALACKHCRAEANPHRSPGELNTSESLHLIRQLGELSPPMLILTGGDPMMRRDIFKLIAAANNEGLRVGLSPAATARLDKIDFHQLRQAGVARMSLSLDGASRETHDSFRKTKGTFDRTVAAIHRARESGIPIQINTTLTQSNLGEFAAFRDLMFELRPAMWSVFVLVPTGRAEAKEVPEPAALETIFEQLADLTDSAPFAIKTTEGHHFRRVLAQKGKLKSRRGMRTPLGIRDGRGVMFISHTGVVSPSGFLPFDCGNVRVTHPADIYRKQALFVSLRDSDALGGKCGRCEFRSICGGSRARAYGLTGDPFAADPSCIYQPSHSS